MSKISFVYFDVGGVAIQDFSDTNKWNVMIEEVLGIPLELRPQFDKLYNQYEDDICEGKIYVDDLKPYIKEKFNPKLSDNFSLLNYFVDNFLPNKSLWEIIANLKKKVKVGLLTDQYPDMLQLIVDNGLFPPITWDAVIDSSIEKVRKPKPDIYQIAEHKAGVAPHEILFIDNREKNLAPARVLGWQTFLYDSRNYEESSKKLSAYLQNLT